VKRAMVKKAPNPVDKHVGAIAMPMAGSTSEIRLIHRSWIGDSISPKPAAVPASISRISLVLVLVLIM
jgi:hypothetical protein